MNLTSERRALLALGLSVLVLLIWTKLYKPPVPPLPQPVAKTAPLTFAPTHVAMAAAPAAASVGAIQGEREERITVDSPLYHVEFSTLGGVARSWQLKKYSDDQKTPRPLDLVNAYTAEQLGAWPLSLALADPAMETAANSALYAVTPSSGPLEAPAELNFEWSNGHLHVIKIFKFGTGYQLDVSVAATFDGQSVPAALAWRGGFGDPRVENAAQTVTVFYDANGKLTLLTPTKLGVKDHTDQRVEPSSAVTYAGIEDRFFAAAFLSSGQDLAIWDWKQDRHFTDGATTSTEPVAEVAVGPNAPAPMSARLYVGPKDLTELNKLTPPLEELVQFGFVGIVAKPLFEVLKWIHHFVPNYGWAIVILTLALNMALFPLKMKSFRQMKQMQKLQPKMESIKQRYAKYSMRDPRRQKMNEEMMALYKEENISPIGGCLPMLMQLPIWWAFYRMLNAAIELRHAPWFGWIHDLSARDPYYILPILMAVSMYWMQKMTPAAPSMDPFQQKMLTFMPLAMGLLFFRLSSGLVLYIFTSNLVGMGQQWYISRTDPAGVPAAIKKKNR
jgi:YidC/Oxa1 family membrane protein insertase